VTMGQIEPEFKTKNEEGYGSAENLTLLGYLHWDKESIKFIYCKCI